MTDVFIHSPLQPGWKSYESSQEKSDEQICKQDLTKYSMPTFNAVFEFYLIQGIRIAWYLKSTDVRYPVLSFDCKVFVNS